MKKIVFRDFCAWLRACGYTDMEIVRLYDRIRDLDADIQGWVADWIGGKGYPQERIEGVTVDELTEKLNLKPMNAFIIMNWLRKNPDEAKYALLNMHAGLEISEKTRETARNCLRELGEETEVEENWDFSDIQIHPED